MFKDINRKIDDLVVKLDKLINGEEQLTIKELVSVTNSISKLLQVKSSNAYKEKEFELRGGDVDFTNPKIQKAFYFLVETFIFSMDEVGVDENTKRKVLNQLTFNLVGFEEKLNKTLKGVKLSMIDQIVNPFAKEVIDKAKDKQ